MDRITPQEKKIRDYLNQRKNTYGENDKSSRSSIRKRKTDINKSYRQKIHSELKSFECQNTSNLDDLDIDKIKRKNWQKSADSPLIDTLSSSYDPSTQSKIYSPKNNLQKEAVKRRNKSQRNK